MSKQRLIPPEFIALVPPSVQNYHEPGPKIKGFIFRMSNGGYYGSFMKGSVLLREDAHVFTVKELDQHIKEIDWVWGREYQGHWIVVYER